LHKANLTGAFLAQILAEGLKAQFFRDPLRRTEKEKDLLKGAIFAKATLSGIDLSGFNLEKANFEEADLTKTKLEDANLSGANFSNAHMQEADLDGSTLNKCIWTGAFTQGMTMGVSSLSHGACTFDMECQNANRKQA